MKKNTKKGMSKGISKRKKVAIGAGVVALSAIGAGAYYLLGPDGKKNQKKAMVLVNKMKKEVISEVKKAKKLSIPVYNKAIDMVSKNYAKKYKEYSKDINAVASRLKADLKKAEAVAKKTVKKATKTATKKRA